jgi:hypothetical protein
MSNFFAAMLIASCGGASMQTVPRAKRAENFEDFSLE